MSTRFISEARIIGEFDSNWPEHVVSKEPMLVNCDVATAYRLGGPITRVFLGSLPPEWRSDDMAVNSWLHQLAPGETPGVSLPTSDHHIMGMVGALDCPVSFYVGTLTVPDGASGLDEALIDSQMQLITLADGHVVEFGSGTIYMTHRAKSSGWRWCISVSHAHAPCDNRNRTQVQVYLGKSDE